MSMLKDLEKNHKVTMADFIYAFENDVKPQQTFSVEKEKL